MLWYKKIFTAQESNKKIFLRKSHGYKKTGCWARIFFNVS